MSGEGPPSVASAMGGMAMSSASTMGRSGDRSGFSTTICHGSEDAAASDIAVRVSVAPAHPGRAPRLPSEVWGLAWSYLNLPEHAAAGSQKLRGRK